MVVDWTRVLPRGRVVDLPLYPWQRERHWGEAAAQIPGAGIAETMGHNHHPLD